MEVQVRTATQHAWAAVEHKLRYKNPREVPDDLKRRLYRLSAIFELADEQFSALRRASDELEHRYSESVRRGELDVDLDLSSLAAYLSVGEAPRLALTRIVAAGFPLLEEPDEARRDRDRRDLLKSLLGAQIGSIQQLDDVLRRAGSATERLGRLKTEFDRYDIALSANPEDLLNLLLFLLIDVSREQVRAIYDESTTEALGRIIGWADADSS